MNFLQIIVLIQLTVNCVKSRDLEVKPNIVIFLSDDLGSYDIGYHGSNHLSTPNIDSLAADGIILNRYYSQPLCSPSRAALLTGIHPIHTRMQHYVLLGAAPVGLPLSHRLLPQYLKDLGYSSHMIGKWHLGFARKEFIPTERGFDSHIGYWNGAEDYYNHTMSERGFEGYDFRHNLDVLRDAEGIYSTDYYTDSALKLISEHNVSKPMLLYMAYQSVHSANNAYELEAPEELIKKFSYIKDKTRQRFAATLYSMDLSIGKIVNELNNKKLLNNTIILFLSDNGAAISGFMENSGSNHPLRGTKGSLWEGGVRVPAFIWSPLLQNSGYVSDSYAQIIDWTPTLLEAIDEKYYKSVFNKFDGISLWKTLSQKKCHSKQNELLLNIDQIWNMSSLIVDDWKLIQGFVPKLYSKKSDDWSQSYDNLSLDMSKQLMLNRFDSTVYKVLKQQKRNINFDIFNETIINCENSDKNYTKCDLSYDLCLFNIRSDPCEYNNLAKNYSNIVQNLWQKILEYKKTALEPLIQIIDPRANPVLHNNTWDIWIK